MMIGKGDGMILDTVSAFALLYFNSQYETNDLFTRMSGLLSSFEYHCIWFYYFDRLS